MDTDYLYSQYVDKKYAEFSSRLTKNHDLPYRGVRIPVLRKIGKELDDFPYELTWHEDVLLKGFWIASRKIPFSEKKELINKHLDVLKTWDEVDTFASSIKPRKNEADEVLTYFLSLMKDRRTMPRRLGIVTLMALRKLFPDHRKEILDAIVAADNDEYYVSMAVAWALSFFYIDDKATEDWIKRVSPATEKRTRQKIRESRRCD